MRKLLLAALAALSVALATSISCKSHNGPSFGTGGECCDQTEPPGEAWCCAHLNCSGGNDYTTEQCEELGFGETGIDTEMDSMTMGTAVSSADSADDSGGECEPDDAVYACHGWVAGVHKDANGNEQFNPYTMDQNAHCVGSGDEKILLTPVPFMGDNYDNEEGFAMCKAACEQLVADGMYGASYWGTPLTGWTYDRTECIFAPDGNNGTIPGTMMQGASELCSWVGKHGDIIDDTPVQIPYVEPAEGDHCAPAVGCGSWNPQSSSNITHNLVGTTHTTWIDDVFAQHVLDTLGDEIYECDTGRYEQAFVSGVEKWSFTNLQSQGEFLYSMGFRSGDYDLKVKKTVGGTYASLNSYAAMADAFDLLYPFPSGGITFQFKRPCTGFCIPTTHTMNVTIN